MMIGLGVVSKKKKVLGECNVIRESSVSWEESFKKRLCLSEEVQFRLLLSLLINVFICRNDKDIHIWKPDPLEKCRVRAFHWSLEVSPHLSPPCSQDSLGFAPTSGGFLLPPQVEV